MGQAIRVEIIGKDEFWGRAFHVEWEDQFPGRKLTSDGSDCFRVEADWLEDLERVGGQCFCKVVRAPDDPRRRNWMRSLIPSLGKK